MRTQVFFLLLVVAYVLGDLLHHQPVAKAGVHTRQVEDEAQTLIIEPVSSGVSAPTTYDAPTVQGFNFDAFAADDFVNEEVWVIDTIDIKIAVNSLDSYDISGVYVAIYPGEGRGMPDYDPYDPTDPAPAWAATYEWESDDPDVEFPEPWLENPVRAGAVIVNTTGEISLIPGTWWLTMHFIIPTSDTAIPRAVWLPGDTDLFLWKPARLYIPGNNPSAGASLAFGWFWNDLENFGIGALAFSLEGRRADFIVDIEDFEVRCPNVLNQRTTVTATFPSGSIDLDIELEADDDSLEVISDIAVLNAANPEATITVRHMIAGNNYQITMRFIGEDEFIWEEVKTVRAVSDVLTPPELVIRDDYGLIGGLFQWRSTCNPEFHQVQMVPSDPGFFNETEIDAFVPGDQERFRPSFSDWDEEGSVNNFDARDQEAYTMRIRATNPSCPTTDPSEWVTLDFTSDSCESFTVELPEGTYNYEKNTFVTSTHRISEYGVVTDMRLDVEGFHQRWTDTALAIGTPVNHLGTTIDVPLFSDGCDEAFDSGNFHIRYVLDGSQVPDDICPPPAADSVDSDGDLVEGATYEESLIDPIGGVVFDEFVRGQEKRGTWSVEWLDRALGFPENGKIERYTFVVCGIPVPPREHIIDEGETKVRRVTKAVYGS